MIAHWSEEKEDGEIVDLSSQSPFIVGMHVQSRLPSDLAPRIHTKTPSISLDSRSDATFVSSSELSDSFLDPRDDSSAEQNRERVKIRVQRLLGRPSLISSETTKTLSNYDFQESRDERQHRPSLISRETTKTKSIYDVDSKDERPQELKGFVETLSKRIKCYKIYFLVLAI